MLRNNRIRFSHRYRLTQLIKLWLLFVGFCLSSSSLAHGLAFANLNAKQLTAEKWQVLFQQRNSKQAIADIDLALPRQCQKKPLSEAFAPNNQQSKQWLVNCPSGAALTWLSLSGTANTQVFFFARNLQQQQANQLSSQAGERFMLPEANAPSQTPPDSHNYLLLGIQHIAEGLDHLAFVLLIMLFTPRMRTLVTVISAFTLGHCLTLAAATFNVIQLKQSFVETLIALSIVFLAIEIIRNRKTLTHQAPAVVALLFGLIHGLGFASVLRSIGLPPENQWQGLLLFNLGVEAGQLLFIALCYPALCWYRRQQHPWPRQLVGYGIGAIAVYWSVLRVSLL